VPSVNILIESPVSQSTRSQQLQAIFDVPAIEKARLTLAGEFPYDDADWNVGLIVGPSGCGKSTILREVFGDQTQLEWGAAGVIDDFRQDISIQEISEVCQAVGFNTIPAWVRPYAVLSNGEKFRVDLARRLIESSATIVVDEFTSVVDRQVAQIGAHAVQKYARRRNLKFVAASCHYDIIDWLQPDWMLEPATMTFTRRSLRRRPEVECQLARVPYDTWRIFAPFHYLTSDLHRAARCFALSVNGRIAAFAGMLHRPHPHLKGGTLWGCSRLVTLPDFQGLGLAFVLIDRIGAMYAALGKRIRTYPAHPALIRAFDHSKLWALKIKPGYHMSPRHHAMSGWRPGARPCAVFEYCGPAHEDRAEAELVIG
jgi:ABC-type ATPase involved in cell division/GNAT superfamily N-acetyltransferase